MSEHATYTLDEIEQQTGFDKRTIAYYVQQGLLPKVGRRGPKTRYPRLFLDRLQFVNLIREKQDLGEIGSLTLAEIGDILDRVPAETISAVAAGTEPLAVLNHLIDLKPVVDEAPTREPDPPQPDPPSDTQALAEEVAEISEALFDPAEIEIAVKPDFNRKVRLGLMDANSVVPHPILHEVPSPALQPEAAGGDVDMSRFAGAKTHPPRRYEDEIRKKADAESADASPTDDQPDSSDADNVPPPIEIERLGWFLARLQRALTGDRRRRTGTTESWHRALITPELTISARNLKDEDAHMLDGVARILKKLLWKAWEE
jgi:DNA-binding transcriptional MerR regulator